MLEILALVALSRKVKRLMKAKGRKSGWYQALVVFLWVGGEIAGFALGALLFGNSPIIYGFGILGAGVGALVAYLIARSVTPAAGVQEPQSNQPMNTF